MIPQLKTVPTVKFSGKNLNTNLTDMQLGDLLAANNVQILGDGVLRNAPGYTLVKNFLTGPTARIYDFQRDVDKAQFVIVQHGGKIDWMNADGTGGATLSTGESGIPYEFVKNAFALYGSDGVNAWRFVDNAGTLTKYQWGITPPSVAVGITISGSSSLVLTYGRQYCYCYVSEITDSLGIVRTSVSAPSPMSAHTGPVTNEVITLNGIVASTDPQVNKIWIFETYDGPLGTQSTFYFAAEITNGTTVFADTLPDTALDSTRQAPFNINNPAPPSAILFQFQNRVVAPTPDFIQYSAFEEALLGIPEECWPPLNFFGVPSGSKAPTAAITHDSGSSAFVSTVEAFMNISGYDSTTLTTQDRVLSPGCIGKKAITQTATHLVWLGADKRLWAWNGIASYLSPIPAQALDLSYPLGVSQPGTKSFNELTDAQLSNAELRYFSYAEMHYLVMLASTTNSAVFDWMALWQMNIKNNTLESIYPTDKFPVAAITASAKVLQGNTPKLFLGDNSGNVYVWPSGYTDNGSPSLAGISTGWLKIDLISSIKWLDFEVDNAIAFIKGAKFQVVALDAPDMNAPLITVKASPYPLEHAAGAQIVRVPLEEVKGCGIGRYVRCSVSFPSDGTQHQIRSIELAYLPLSKSVA